MLRFLIFGWFGAEIKFRFKWRFTEEVIATCLQEELLKNDLLVAEKLLIIHETCIVL